uniref:Integrin, alpha 6b n=1 Tax=Scophthalmus maximus TaxID=52904 RepID=A0A8D3ECC3_SCOMX
MAAPLTRALWLLVGLLGCEAFNLDTEHVQRKSGEPGSLFGFSLALHRQLEPQDKRMLLVGAPKAKATKGQKAKVTGGLYSCDTSSISTSCVRVNFDDEEDLTSESKENQWMGVSVSSQGPGGKIVTCAHRYQRRANVNSAMASRDILGRCYVLSQNLKISPGLEEEGGDWHFCDRRARGHEMFGSCQQGLSATFDKDYHYLIFGAPGAYNWRGVVRLEQRNLSLVDQGIFDDGPFETGGESEKNPNLVPAPANSYLGFSLDSGRSLTKKGYLTVVAGAPRANHSGAVVLMKIGLDLSKSLVGEYTLEGEGLASSFGYDLAVLDLNGDGWQDIVVGAPQYFEKDGKIGGAVYVYVNQAGDWNKVKPTRIDGPMDSMFGLAVESLGDINLDGYHDFAVGAPYADEGSGNVYIYSGSATGLSSKKALQVLSGKPLGVRMFGYSLAGNMDLDKNSYPDLAVGSLSDSCAPPRSRPVINIKKEINFSPKEIDLTKKNCGSSFCLDIEACFTYTANPKSYAPKLTVVYSLVADADLTRDGLIHRGTFIGSSASDKVYESKGTITMNSKGAKQCVTRKLAIQENIRDKLRGIPIDVSVDIQEAKRKRRQSSASLAPVLDPRDPMTTRSQVHFLKEGCGIDNVCQSNLQVEYRYGHRATDKDTFVPLELDNGMPLISLSNQNDIALEVTVTNLNGDDAHEASLAASFPRSLAYSTYVTCYQFQDRHVTCRANKDGSKLDCDLGNPFKRDSKVRENPLLAPFTSLCKTSVINKRVTSDQQNIAPVKAKAKVAIMLQLSVTGQIQPSQVYFSGEAKDDRAMKTESDTGIAITHQFRIINLGKPLKDFGSASLNIMWPKGTTQGKRLLYLMKISSTGVDKLDCSPKDEINSLGLVSANITLISDEGTLSRFTETKESISCDNGAQCVTIKCPLRGLDSNAVITVHSRLWNSTFIKVTILTVFPEMLAAQYGGVPWWIIVLSILFLLLLLGLLAFLLWKCGFFKRAIYEDKVPSYNAVWIKREERAINTGNGNWDNLEKKPWITTWHDSEHYS